MALDPADAMGQYFEERWQEAWEVCRRTLNENDLQFLNEIKDSTDFKDSIERMSIDFMNISKNGLINQLNPSLGSIQNFLTFLAVSMGSRPISTAIIWGLLSLAVRLVARMSTILPETIEMLDTLGHDLEILQILESSFDGNPQIGQELIDIFVEIITFWTKAIRFLRRNTHGTAATYWPHVKADFEKSSKKIRTRSTRIKEKADASASAMAMRRPAALLQAIDDLRITSTSSMIMDDTDFPCHNIPFGQNTRFQARESEIINISRALAQDPEHPGMRSFALWGLGGIGKTQLALAYAYKELNAGIQAVLWINCDKGLSVGKSFTEIAVMLKLPGADADTISGKNRDLVLEWLRKTRMSWLLVLDNVEQDDLVRDCWPVASHGAVLITSRRPIFVVDPAGGGTQIRQFSDPDGGSLLMSIVSKYPYTPNEEKAAQLLSKELGGHGLALAVMGAQVYLRRKSFEEFLPLYKKFAESIHKDTRGVGAHYRGSLHTCLSAAFETLSQKALTILGVLALLGPDNVPENIFHGRVPDELKNELGYVDDELGFEDALNSLLDTSLVTRDSETKMLFTHRLTQYEFRKHESFDVRKDIFFRLAFSFLHTAFPKQIDGLSMRKDWDRCKAYVDHVLILCAHWQTYKFAPEVEDQFNDFTKLLANCAWYLLEASAWSEEVELMETAFQSCQDTDGVEFAHLCNTHGQLQLERGNPSAGLKLLDKALKIRKRLFGENHAETANTYNNYGNAILQAYETPDAPRQALPYYLKTLELDNLKPAGERKQCVYPTLLNISRVYRLLEEYETAMRYVDEAEDSVENMFGPGTHFDASVKTHRANILFDRMLVDEAEILWREAFATFFTLNEMHPVTLSVQLKLACLDMRRGEAEKAIETMKRILLICNFREKAKGDKGEVARVTWKYAQALALKGKTVEAAQLAASAEEMRTEIQKNRTWQPPNEERRYDILVFHAFW